MVFVEPSVHGWVVRLAKIDLFLTGNVHRGLAVEAFGLSPLGIMRRITSLAEDLPVIYIEKGCIRFVEKYYFCRRVDHRLIERLLFGHSCYAVHWNDLERWSE